MACRLGCVSGAKAACILLVPVLLAQTRSGNALPTFADYPVDVVSTVGSVSPKLTTPQQRRVRTVIRQSVAKGPNFAGRYTIAQWGCGTGCIQFVVVDNRSGMVYDGAAGSLPFAIVCFGANPDRDKTGISFEPDSSLLIVRGCPNDKDCGAIYYEWTGSHFKVLRRVPMKPVLGCEP